MSALPENAPPVELPSAEQIHLAVGIYLELAYENGPCPPLRCLPPHPLDVAAWLMGDTVEREPPDAPLGQVSAFTLRLGNSLYPHMKLRLARPPHEPVYVFTVDSHDAFLRAMPGGAECGALEELKTHNMELSRRIRLAWQKAHLLTEESYMRRKLHQARQSRDER